jgi:hypothetical protein
MSRCRSLMRGGMVAVGCCVALTPMLAAQKVAGDRVGGTVVSALDGHPLAGAMLTLTQVYVDATPEVVTATTRADEEGHFQFGPVPAGKYRITGAVKNYLPTAYLQHEIYSTALVTGAGLPTDALEMRLQPAAEISGRVVDDAGEPLMGATVELYYENLTTSPKVPLVLSALVDDDGEYEFDGLQRGRYYLSVDATPWYAVHPSGDPAGTAVAFREAIDPALDVTYPVTFYADATDSDDATALTIAGGDHLSADLHLHVQQAVTLTLHLPAGQQAEGNMPGLSRRVFGVESPVAATQGQMNGDAGEIKLSGIAPGRYEVSLGGRDNARIGMVDLTGGSANVEVPKVEAADVTVMLHGLKEDVFTGVAVSMQREGSSIGDQGLGGTLIDQGVAVFRSVPVGEYRFSVFAGGKMFGVESISVDGRRSPNGRLLVTHNVSVDVDVTSTRVAVEGFARRAGGAAPGAMVVLVPAGGDTGEALFRRDQSDLDGSFLFRDVVPGNYIVVAIDDGWGLAWNDIKAMTPYLMKGLPVSIKDGGPAEVKLAAVQTQPK